MSEFQNQKESEIKEQINHAICTMLSETNFTISFVCNHLRLTIFALALLSFT